MTRRALKRRAVLAGSVLAVALGGAAAVAWLNVRDDAPGSASAANAGAGPAQRIARGEYLVRAGSCAGCHTERGGAAFAGGRAIETPFGNVYAPNLTPDPASGIGAWSADDFWHSLHNGRSRDGRLLYPAFPYPNYTRLERSDADAMFAYLQSLAPVARPNTPHALRFPFDQPAALAVWRALFFRPARFEAEPGRPPEWNRGAYLVEALGHCNACHAERNALGATSGPLDLAGGMIPIRNWYAPSLNDGAEAGVAGWPAADVAALLRSGVSPRGVAQGPMAEVVAGSTQYLSDADLASMVAYLQALPGAPAALTATATPAAAPAAGAPEEAAGRRLYEQHCSGCHGTSGEGVAGAYPALAGNRSVAMAEPVNLVHVVLGGGFAPATAGNPRPFGMPPFATVLADGDVAAVLSYVRGAWGNRAPPVTPLDVARARNGER